MPFGDDLLSNVDGGMPKKRSAVSLDDALTRMEQSLAEGDLSTKLVAILELCATAGILSFPQITRLVEISERSLKRYISDCYLNSQPTPMNLRWYGIDPTVFGRRIYHLGVRGVAYAILKRRSAKTFTGYPFIHTDHDLFCNELVARLLARARECGFAFEWRGAYESRLSGDDEQPILEPDAFLRFLPSTFDALFGVAVEYHNEDDRRRVADKIDRYEHVAAYQLWRTRWRVSEMPVVLVAFTSDIVLDGYVQALARLGSDQVRCRYLAKSLTSILDDERDIGRWAEINGRAFDGQWRWVDLFEQAPA